MKRHSNKIILLSSTLLIFLSFLGIVISANSYRQIDNEKNELFDLLTQMRNISDELTYNAQTYVTQNILSYKDAYDKEVNVDKRRENIIIRVKEIGSPDSEYQYLLNALEYSNKLCEEFEIPAFELVSASQNSEAIALMFNANYSQYKEKIYESLNAFYSLVVNRYEGKLSNARALQTIILSISLSVQMIAFIVIYLYNIKNIKLNRNKNIFISRMSHELRTPINAIFGMSQIAQKSKNLDEIKYCLNEIDLSSKNLLSIINEVLDISKIELKKFELKKEELNFINCLSDSKNLLLTMVGNKKMDLNYFIDNSISYNYFGDNLRITQMVTNLLVNATKFSKNDSSINIYLKELNQKNNFATLELKVEDFGIGMTEEQVNKIFIPFQQADQTISKRFGGTGLGLSICKTIVEMMNGKISIQSKIDEGSTFICTFELELNTDVDNYLKENSLNIKEVLYIGKEVSSKLLIGNLNKFNPFELKNIDIEELDVNSLSNYNIIFLDELAVEYNGLELAKRILKYVTNGKIILISNKEIKHQIDINDKKINILYKPFDFRTLTQLINNENIIYLPSKKTTFPNKKVLLVDDIDINNDVLEAYLSDSKIEILKAEDGLIAFESFKNNLDIDVILMDINMPKVDGLTATKMIRKLGVIEAKTVTIIGVSANAIKEEMEDAFKAGMNDYLTKPIDHVDLLAMLNKYL